MDEKKTLKEQLGEVKESAKEKVTKVTIWLGRHKQEILVFGPIVLTSTIELLKILSKRHNLNEEKHLKDNYIYDREMGHYYETSRKLKGTEWLFVEQKKNEGESIGIILQDMDVLK